MIINFIFNLNIILYLFIVLTIINPQNSMGEDCWDNSKNMCSIDFIIDDENICEGIKKNDPLKNNGSSCEINAKNPEKYCCKFGCKLNSKIRDNKCICNTNHYEFTNTIGKTCKNCGTETGNNYQYSEEGSNNINRCYLTTTAGKYVETAGAGLKQCEGGYYCPGGDIVHYNEIGGAKICTNLTNGSSPSGAYPSSAPSSAREEDCYVSVSSGMYLPANKKISESCKDNADLNGYYCPGSKVHYPVFAKLNNATDNPAENGNLLKCPIGYENSDGERKSINDCYLVATEGEGNYVETAGSGLTKCKENYFCPGGTLIHYGKHKTKDDYNDKDKPELNGNLLSCSAVTKHYPSSAPGSAREEDCYISVSPGMYIKSKDEELKQCEKGYYCPGGTIVHYPVFAKLDNATTNPEENGNLLKCPKDYPNTEHEGADTISKCYRLCNNNELPNCKIPTSDIKFNFGDNQDIIDKKITDCKCERCNEGYYVSNSGKCEKKIECSKGKYLPANETTCKECKDNTDLNGYYCPSIKDISPNSENQGITKCPIGYENSDGQREEEGNCYRLCNNNELPNCKKSETKIRPGSTSSVDCKCEVCMSGTFLTDEKKCNYCSKDYFCPEGGEDKCNEILKKIKNNKKTETTENDIWEKGKGCKCPAGMFTDGTGKKSINECYYDRNTEFCFGDAADSNNYNCFRIDLINKFIYNKNNLITW